MEEIIEQNVFQYSIKLGSIHAVSDICIPLLGIDLEYYSITGNNKEDNVDFVFKTKLNLQEVQEVLYESGANLELLKQDW